MVSYTTVHSLWLVRNYALSREIVPFTTNSGVMFFIGNETVKQFDVKRNTVGNGPDETGLALYRASQDEIAASLPRASLPSLEARTDQQLLVRARRFAVKYPLFMLRKVATGVYLIWFLSHTSLKSYGWMIFQVPLVIITIIGLFQGPKWTFPQRLLLGVVIAFIMPLTLLASYARYSLPVIPILIVFSSFVLLNLWNRFCKSVLWRPNEGKFPLPAETTSESEYF